MPGGGGWRTGHQPRGADLRANCRSWRQRKGCRRARRQFLPQHSTEPSVLTPQVWKSPALTEAKVPSGGEACPLRSQPQHAIEPLALMPQVWTFPALTEANVPSSIEACPWVLSPQQATNPSVPIPQVWRLPALTEANVPAGGLAARRATSPPPQQATDPSDLIPQVW